MTLPSCGGLPGVHVEVLLEDLEDGVAAHHRAQRVGADADEVLAGRRAPVHRVERRDRGDLGGAQAQLPGAEGDSRRREIAVLGLDQVQQRQQCGPCDRVAARRSGAASAARRSVTSAEYDCGPREIGGPGSSGRGPSRSSTRVTCAISSSRKRSSVHSAHHRVDRRHRRDRVGDHAALAHRRHRLQIGERRVAVVHAVRAGCRRRRPCARPVRRAATRRRRTPARRARGCPR